MNGCSAFFHSKFLEQRFYAYARIGISNVFFLIEKLGTAAGTRRWLSSAISIGTAYDMVSWKKPDAVRTG